MLWQNSTVQWQHQSGVRRNGKKSAFSLWPPKRDGRVPSKPTARESQALLKKMFKSLKLWTKHEPVQSHAIVSFTTKSSPLWEECTCLFQPGVGWRGEMREKQATEVRCRCHCFPSPHPLSQAGVGPVERNQVQGKEENCRVDNHFLEVSGENGLPHNPDQGLSNSLTSISTPTSHAAVPITTWGLSGQQHRLPFWFILHILAKKSPKMCVWSPVPLYWTVWFCFYFF